MDSMDLDVSRVKDRFNEFLLEHDVGTTYKNYFLNKWGVDPDLVLINNMEVDAIICNNIVGRANGRNTFVSPIDIE